MDWREVPQQEEEVGGPEEDCAARRELRAQGWRLAQQRTWSVQLDCAVWHLRAQQGGRRVAGRVLLSAASLAASAAPQELEGWLVRGRWRQILRQCCLGPGTRVTLAPRARLE